MRLTAASLRRPNSPTLSGNDPKLTRSVELMSITASGAFHGIHSSAVDTSEITINQIVGFVWDEEGTDVEDELPTPASSPTQIVVPAIPPAGTADPFGQGESFDLELAKVICDVSVLPSLA